MRVKQDISRIKLYKLMYSIFYVPVTHPLGTCNVNQQIKIHPGTPYLKIYLSIRHISSLTNLIQLQFYQLWGNQKEEEEETP